MLILPATAGDSADIEALLDDCFGPQRHTRTAYRLRVGAAPVRALSQLVRTANGQLIGSIQYWRLDLVGDGGSVAHPLTLLGPIAVTPAARRSGVGRRLIEGSLKIADARGHDAILLIGDHSYYGRFGFSAAATGGWRLPGPVERERLLLRQTDDGRVLPVHAEVRALRGQAAA